MKNRICIFSLLITGIIIIVATSCKKKNNDDNPPVVTTVTDVDGNVYNTVIIGTQAWMTENLKVTHYRDTTAIPEVIDSVAWKTSSSGAYCNYNNDIINGNIYGKLYNWFAVNSTHNLAPAGWHVATDADWTVLSDYLGGSAIAGGILKESGTSHWNSPNSGATNNKNFGALPGGFRHGLYGTFSNIKDDGEWWSATSASTTQAFYRSMDHTSSILSRYSYLKTSGYSVRCVKD